MAKRVTTVSLTAQVSNYITEFERVNQKNKQVGESADAARQKFEDQNAAMTKIGAGLTAFGAIAAVAVGIAVSKFADFDAAMSNVEAATHESAANMALLRDAALDAGARTVFSATEAANAIEELGKAGLSTSDILNGGLDGALDLAAAGGLGVAEAAGIAATALKQFNLSGSDMAHVADLLAAGAGKAMGDVTDLSAALSQSGMVASSTGLSIEETTGTLAAFASQGLLGSDAGTSFKSMLQRLTPQSNEAAAKMKELGISAYDAAGNFIGMEKFAGNLQTSLAGLTTEQRNSALATIFGSDAVRAATVLYTEGANGISEWNAAVDDGGYAAETAAMRLDNLKGDVEALGGAFDTALIQSGSAADGTLRFLVQAATELIDVFNSAPLPIQQTALAVAAVTAAASLAGGAFLLGVPKIAEFSAALAVLTTSQIPGVAAAALAGQTAIANMGKTAAATAKFMTGPWGIAMVAAGIGVSLLVKYVDSLRATSTEMENSLVTAASAAGILKTATKGQEFTAFRDMGAVMSDLSGQLDLIADQSENFFSTFGNYGIQASKNSLGKIGDDLGKLAGKDMPAASRAFRLLADETDGTDRQLNALLNSMPAYRQALIEQATELGVNVDGLSDAEANTKLLKIAQDEGKPTTLEAADAYLEASDKASELTDKLSELVAMINESNDVGQDAVSANADWLDALEGITAEIETQKAAYQEANGTLDGFTFSLDEATVSGSANAAMLSDTAAKAQAAALAQFEVDKKTMGAKEATDKYIGTLSTSRQSLIDQAVANGANREEVTKLADKIFALPDTKSIDVLVETAAAERKLASFKKTMDDVQNKLMTAIDFDAPAAKGKATGGAIYGPGGPTSDEAGLFRLSNGEHVLDSEDVRRMGGQAGVYKFRESLYGGMATGGAVQYASAGASSTSVSVSPSVSLAGATLNATIDGQPIRIMIQDQIAVADQSNARAIRRGRQG